VASESEVMVPDADQVKISDLSRRVPAENVEAASTMIHGTRGGRKKG
jgi:hypothetical protein